MSPESKVHMWRLRLSFGGLPVHRPEVATVRGEINRGNCIWVRPCVAEDELWGSAPVSLIIILGVLIRLRQFQQELLPGPGV